MAERSTLAVPARQRTVGDPDGRRHPSPTWIGRIPAAASGVVAALAVLALVLMFVPLSEATMVGRAMLVFAFYYVDIQPNLGWVTALLLVSAALGARKRAAWILVLAYLVFYLLADVVALIDRDANAVGALVVHVIVTAALIIGVREFYARVRGGAWWTALLTGVGMLVAGMLIGWGLIESFPGTTVPGQRLSWATSQVGGFGLQAVSTELVGEPPGWVLSVLGLFSMAATVGATAVLLRSRRGGNGMSAHDESALRVLIDRFGNDDSLAYFATRHDKSVVFAEDGRAAVAYRIEAGVCLAAGDPVGDPHSWPGAIDAWLNATSAYGWIPAVLGVSHRGAQAYHRQGFSILELGDEAVLVPEDFSLRGRDRATLRQAVTRATRSGVGVRIRRHHDVPPEELRRLGALADRWRGEEDERGFSMALGRWGDPDDGQCLLVEGLLDADTPDEKAVGILSFVPWGATGASLDVMRRAEDAPNGTFEVMVTELCRRADEFGVRRISLNFAMFRSTFEEGAELGAGPVIRAWRAILLFLSRWWQLESLYRSNVKYAPIWSARYLGYGEARQLPRISIAVGIAEGFLYRARQRWHVKGSAGMVASNAPSLASLADQDHQPRQRRLPDQVRVRVNKAERLLDDGIDPWPVASAPNLSVHDLRGQPSGTPASIAGRVHAIRDFGGVVFVELRDWSGTIQVILERERCGRESILDFRSRIDLGDLIGVSGSMGASRKGEPSLLAQTWRLNAKCLHPMPDKRHGIADPEARVRQRHLDIATNPGLRGRLKARSAVVHSMRTTLVERGFLEVETPILQTIHGGANARPFRTHINAYNLDLYLRIAPELFLKRLAVGGMDKIFELGRTFRNEGVDFSHNPEFTILEAYEAHGDYLTMMDLCRRLIQNAAIAANGSCVVPDPEGNPVDISGPWPVVSLHDAVSDALVARGGHRIDAQTPVERLRAQCDLAGVSWNAKWDAGAVALEMYEHLVEETTTRPTFYTDFPLSVSPLTRSHRSVAGVTERWDLVAWGVELGTAYSELTDPLEQRKRLTAQSEEAAGGDPEAMELDEDFLTALEYGMPPTGGLGIGVDRIVMLITGASIRETLPFPMTRPQ